MKPLKINLLLLIIPILGWSIFTFAEVKRDIDSTIFVPIRMFDVELSLPQTVEKLSNTHPSTIKYFDPVSEVTWFVERRGKGVFTQSPFPLNMITRRFIATVGGDEKTISIPVEIAGQPAEKTRFTVKDRIFVAFVVFYDGYVYAFGVTGYESDAEEIAIYADIIEKSLKFPDLADIGLQLHGTHRFKLSFCEYCKDTEHGVYLFNSTNLMGIEIARIDKKDSPYTQKTDTQLQEIFKADGCEEVGNIRPIIIDRSKGRQIACFARSSQNNKVLILSSIVEYESYSYRLSAMCDAARQKELYEFSEKILRDIKFIKE